MGITRVFIYDVVDGTRGVGFDFDDGVGFNYPEEDLRKMLEAGMKKENVVDFLG